MTIQERVMVERARRGLRLVFAIPGREDMFTAYPATEEQKQKWIESSKRKGWVLCES